MASIQERLAEQGMQRGVCRVCGEPARDKRSYYCEEHRKDSPYAARKADAETEGGEVIDLALSMAKAAAKKAPKVDDVVSVLEPLATVVVNFIVLSPLKRLPDELAEQVAAQVSVDDAEIEAILRPLVRIGMRTSQGAAAATLIAENADLVAAGMALVSLAQKAAQVQQLVREWEDKNGVQHAERGTPTQQPQPQFAVSGIV